MRRILIESARARNSQKRGGDRQRIASEDFVGSITRDPDTLLDVDAELGRLSQEDAGAAELVKLRLYAGLSVTEAGQLLRMSRSTAYETWDFARSWFALHLPPVST